MGDPYVLEALWQQLGIAEVIAETLGRRKFDFPVERALFAMVANRPCAGSSKLYCYEQWLEEDVRIAGAEQVQLQHLYRAMDFLEENQEAIQERLYYRLADLLNLDVDLMFYDTASLHFEVDEADTAAQYGSQPAGGKAHPALRKGASRKTGVTMHRNW